MLAVCGPPLTGFENTKGELPHLSSSITVQAWRLPLSSSRPPAAAKPRDSPGRAHHSAVRTGSGSSCQQGSKGRCVATKASGGRKKGSGWSRAALHQDNAHGWQDKKRKDVCAVRHSGMLTSCLPCYAH
jgi:hypothetical protein